MDRDLGDEDDIATSPRRFWPRIIVGRAICCEPLSWTHEHLPPLQGHDPGDEDHFAWLRVNSDVTQVRVLKRLFG
jgi:hypothetical protein